MQFWKEELVREINELEKSAAELEVSTHTHTHTHTLHDRLSHFCSYLTQQLTLTDTVHCLYYAG